MISKKIIIAGLAIIIVSSVGAYYVLGNSADKKKAKSSYCNLMKDSAHKAVESRSEGISKETLIRVVKDAISNSPRDLQADVVEVIEDVYRKSSGTYEYYPDQVYDECMAYSKYWR